MLKKLRNFIGIDKKMISHLNDKYGSIEEFVRAFREGKIQGKDLSFAETTIKQAIDMDRDEHSDNYDELISNVFNQYWNELAVYKSKSVKKELIFYSSKELKKCLKVLTPNQIIVLEERYGLRTGKKISLDKTAEKLRVSRERVRQMESSAFRELRANLKKSKVFYNPLLNDNYITENERERILKCFEMINNSNIIFNTEKKVSIDEEIIRQESKFMDSLRTELIQRKKEKIIEANKDKTKSISIKKLHLSNRPTNALEKAGIHTLEELTNLTGKEFYEIKGIGIDCVEEVTDKLIELGLCFKPEELTKLQKSRRKRDRLQKMADRLIEKAEKAKELSDTLDGIIEKNNKQK